MKPQVGEHNYRIHIFDYGAHFFFVFGVFKIPLRIITRKTVYTHYNTKFKKSQTGSPKSYCALYTCAHNSRRGNCSLYSVHLPDVERSGQLDQDLKLLETAALVWQPISDFHNNSSAPVLFSQNYQDELPARTKLEPDRTDRVVGVNVGVESVELGIIFLSSILFLSI